MTNNSANVAEVPELTPEFRIKLTVPFVAFYLSLGYSQSKIASIARCNPHAVSSYISRHSNELAPLANYKGKNDLTALKSLAIASQAQDIILRTLYDHRQTWTKKDIYTLSTISAMQIDKFRLLTDKSTENVSIHTLTKNAGERDKRLAQLRNRLDYLEGKADQYKED